MISIHERAKGRWPAILPILGVPADYLRNKHGPCPLCETPKKWFRFDDKDGTGSWICNQCGAGNGVDLVMRRNGLSFVDAAKEIERHIDGAPVCAMPPSPDTADLRQKMQRTWDAARLIQEGSAAATYLQRRIGLTTFPRELRAHGRLYCYEGDGLTPSLRPALLARVRDIHGKPVTVHRTYLTHEGTKAAVDKPKRLMKSGPLPDVCSIPLAPVAETLGVAEGIETALSATALFGTPCWAVISTAFMEKWAPPGGVRNVVIFADHDESCAGQHAAFELRHRLLARGLKVELKKPDVVGEDWNDVLRRKLGAS